MMKLAALIGVLVLAGCSVVSGQVSIPPEGGLSVGATVNYPGTDKTVVSGDAYVDLFGVFEQSYGLLKGLVDGAEETP